MLLWNIAWRYIWSKKSTQAINIISWVSIIAMAIGSAALIIVLSVFNGFEGFIKSLYTDFYPDIKLTATQGKYFEPNQLVFDALKNENGISAVSATLEEKLLLSYNESQTIATIKGIDTAYSLVTAFEKRIKYGSLPDTMPDAPPIVLGLGVSNRLGANEESPLPITAYSFKGTIPNILTITESYTSSLFTVSGIFLLQDEIDNQYAFTHLPVLQELVEKPNTISSLELKLQEYDEAENIATRLNKKLSAHNIKASTRYEQNKTLYFILNMERWAVYAILTLMLIIASFNIVGSLSMLVLEKQHDISILKAMGLPIGSVRGLFLRVGLLLSLIGTILGCALAAGILLLQQHFGFVKMGKDAFIIDAYPVQMRVQDFVLVMFTVVVLAVAASFFPSRRAGVESA